MVVAIMQRYHGGNDPAFPKTLREAAQYFEERYMELISDFSNGANTDSESTASSKFNSPVPMVTIPAEDYQTLTQTIRDLTQRVGALESRQCQTTQLLTEMASMNRSNSVNAFVSATSTPTKMTVTSNAPGIPYLQTSTHPQYHQIYPMHPQYNVTNNVSFINNVPPTGNCAVPMPTSTQNVSRCVDRFVPLTVPVVPEMNQSQCGHGFNDGLQLPSTSLIPMGVPGVFGSNDSLNDAQMFGVGNGQSFNSSDAGMANLCSFTMTQTDPIGLFVGNVETGLHHSVG